MPRIADSGSGPSNADVIYQFLAAKGLSTQQAAGIMGNFATESSYNPHALNSREGAIGLAQWEGGRRAELQRFAAQRGTSETDLNTQLEFFWHEFTSGGYYKTVKTMNDAGNIAAWIDQHYERSAGTSRSARITNAKAVVQSVKNGKIVGGVVSGGGGASAKASEPTAADYKTALGASLSGLLTSIPELKQVMDRAIKIGQAPADFADAIEGTNWWKTHSSTVRSNLALQINDPATYKQNIAQAEFTVNKLAQQFGAPILQHRAHEIAQRAVLYGQTDNQQWLNQQVAAGVNLNRVNGGQLAQYALQLKQIGLQYGYQWSDVAANMMARNIVAGKATIDTYTQSAMNYAKSAFPGYAKQIDDGQTIADLAQPYIDSMSSVLELNPQTLNTRTSLIRKAMQGVQSAKGETPSPVPIWKFEQQLRADPRWQFTDNAKQSTLTALHQIGVDFGFSS